MGNKIIYTKEVLKSNFCDFNDAYILVRGNITVAAAPAIQVAFKYCAPFTECITKINETINDAEDLNLVISMYNLIKCSSNYSDSTGSLRFYSKDEATNFGNDIVNTDDFKSFKYKAKLLGHTGEKPTPNQAIGILENATITVPSEITWSTIN